VLESLELSGKGEMERKRKLKYSLTEGIQRRYGGER
jgi:hypothetical protein